MPLCAFFLQGARHTACPDVPEPSHSVHLCLSRPPIGDRSGEAGLEDEENVRQSTGGAGRSLDCNREKLEMNVICDRKIFKI